MTVVVEATAVVVALGAVATAGFGAGFLAAVALGFAAVAGFFWAAATVFGFVAVAVAFGFVVWASASKPTATRQMVNKDAFIWVI
ncbi:hypothetical protein GCM10027299_56650 [Larkinella ripae]